MSSKQCSQPKSGIHNLQFGQVAKKQRFRGSLDRLGQSQVVTRRGSKIQGPCSLQMGSKPPRSKVGWIVYSVHHAVSTRISLLEFDTGRLCTDPEGLVSPPARNCLWKGAYNPVKLKVERTNSFFQTSQFFCFVFGVSE